uniref:Caspase 8 associated protein 2 n=1 Tax=Hippocampus comes TaxID=109280 RepID=A0A3Q2YRZ9_HIPCM
MHRRLQKMEIENTGLNTENTHLKKNISALLRTARQEIMRKDAVIQRLNQSHPPKVPPRPPRRESPSPNRKANTSCTETRHSKGPTSGHGLVPEKRNEHCISNSLISSSTRHHGSDQHKTKDREKQCQKRFDTTDKKYGTSSAPRRDRYSVEKDRPHKSDKDTGRRYESRICKTRDNKNVDGYHRSERSKSPPFEKSHAIGSSDAYKARTGEKRHKTPSLDSQHSTHLRGTEDYSRHREKIILKHSGSQREHSDSKDQKRSSLNRQAENYSDFPKEMQRDKLSKDYQWKEDRQHEEMTSSHRRTSSSERSRRERQGKTGKTSAKEPVEENGQNSKLCFMETLNLTLSPIKKTVPNNTIQEGLTALHHIFQNGPHDGLQSDLHARDQIDGNELKGTEKLLSDSVDSPTSKKLQVNDVQEKDTSDHETRLDTQQAEGNSIQAISSCQSIDSAANRMSTHHNPKAQGNTSRKRKDRKDDIKAKFRPDVQLDSHEQPDETEFNNLYGNVTGKQPSSSLQKVDSGRNKYQRAAVAQCAASSEKNSKGRVLGTKAPDKVMEYAVTPKHIFLPEDIEANPGAQQTYLIISQDSLPGVNPPLFSSPTNEDTHCAQDDFRDTDAVSSTINVELGPQQEVSLPEAINFFMKRDNGGSLSPVTDPSTSIGVSKVSSTTEEIVPPKNSCEFTVSPKKKSSEKTPEKNVELSISMPLLHDEDSMMRMLCHLKRIPDAISPLRSPIHLMKTSRHCVLGKPGHVKSLQKGNIGNHDTFFSVVLKNQCMGGLVTCCDMLTLLRMSKNILVHSTESANKANLLKRKSEATSLASKEKTTIASVSTQSPRNKTACPKSAKASFSTIEEVMEMFTSLRSEIRKKYMKLHKTFPKKIFFSVMEHSRESLMQFVDGAHFGQICCQAVELKSKLKILIVSVFNKVADNGIVKRIFDQQAVDLKQKLWAFVDDQVEFLLKDVYMTLKSLCRPAKTLPEENMSSDTERLLRLPREKMQTRKDTKGALSSVKHIKPCAAPHQTGLGSKGKDIRISPTGNEKRHGHKHNYGNIDPGVDCTPQKSPVSEKHKMASLVASQSTSMLEKSDFELLTEQQATSLTFNLVRDSQMGEIFKCLLQGSDLLETNAMIGEGTSWALCTPKKNGERLISITTPNKFESPSKFLSPTKFDTPSKLIATWSSILPRDMSPPSKNRDRPNPALFDESCLLEVPSENQATLHSSCLSQRNYSILDEDLAVSLTIPSPLKSDSHLSFLQPSGLHVVSTPDSVISAHISEDALLDGEDATVQDIHLALDTDNSSLGSSNSVASPAALNTFVLKPELPMQALVMEKSNDHFIVKIRQGNIQTGLNVPTDETLVQTRTEEAYRGEDMAARERQGKYLFNEMHKYAHPCSLSDLSEDPVTCQDVSSEIGFTEDHFRLKKQPPLFDHLSTTSEGCATKNLNKGASPKATFKIATYKETFLEHTLGVKLMKDENPNPTFDMEKHSPDPLCPSETNPPESQNSTSPYTRTEQGNSESSEIIQTSQEMSKCSYMQSEMETSKSDRIAEDTSTATGESKKDRPKSEKRKKHQEPSKAKRPRKDEENTMEDNASSSKNDVKSKSLPSSPHSLSARNVIKKRGALVMTWTRSVPDIICQNCRNVHREL